LQRRYRQLVVAHLSPNHRVASGLQLPASVKRPFSTAQAAWRFFSNERVSLSQLADPLIQCAREDIPEVCDNWLLVAMDWSSLHFGHHASKMDRVQLAHSRDWGYDLLTALAIGDRDGSPIAPLCLELRAEEGVYSTRSEHPLDPVSVLDGLEPVMAHVDALGLDRSPVFIIDRQADSVGHYRTWDSQKRKFLIRADNERLVLHDGMEVQLSTVVTRLKRRQAFSRAGTVLFKGRKATQFVAETEVVLHRPARTHRVDPRTGVARHKNVPGPPLRLRFVVSEVRDDRHRVLGRWLLLTNLPDSVSSATAALWYYWRWRIESYHKLLKGAGQQVECWQQSSAETFSRRLLVAAMSAVIVYRLARDDHPEAAELRDVLVRLSGRQMKRGRHARSFTEPALLAGLGVLLPMLDYLSQHSISELQHMVHAALQGLLPNPTDKNSLADDG